MSSKDDESGYWDAARCSYIKVWTQGLRVLLGWTEVDTLKWAKQWDESLSEESRIFYHRPPEEWMAFVVASSSVDRTTNKKCDGRGLNKLAKLVAEAIQSSSPQKDVDAYTDEDWFEAGLRVDAVLRRHGRALGEN